MPALPPLVVDPSESCSVDLLCRESMPPPLSDSSRPSSMKRKGLEVESKERSPSPLSLGPSAISGVGVSSSMEIQDGPSFRLPRRSVCGLTTILRLPPLVEPLLPERISSIRFNHGRYEASPRDRVIYYVNGVANGEEFWGYYTHDALRQAACQDDDHAFIHGLLNRAHETVIRVIYTRSTGDCLPEGPLFPPPDLVVYVRDPTTRSMAAVRTSALSNCAQWIQALCAPMVEIPEGVKYIRLSHARLLDAQADLSKSSSKTLCFYGVIIYQMRTLCGYWSWSDLEDMCLKPGGSLVRDALDRAYSEVLVALYDKYDADYSLESALPCFHVVPMDISKLGLVGSPRQDLPAPDKRRRVAVGTEPEYRYAVETMESFHAGAA